MHSYNWELKECIYPELCIGPYGSFAFAVCLGTKTLCPFLLQVKELFSSLGVQYYALELDVTGKWQKESVSGVA